MEQVETSQAIGARHAAIPTWSSRSVARLQAVPRWAWMVAVGAIAVLIVFSRRPDALLNPQFLSEDGTYFYADAYNLGPIAPFFKPVAGYLLLSDRLIGLIAVQFPLRWGPVIFNVYAIFFQILPAVFLLSRRFDRLIPSWPARLFLAFFYLAIPNSFELDATVTNIQWHLALLAFMIVVAAPPASAFTRVRDIGIVLLAGLSTPLCFILVPVIALYWWHTRARWTAALLAADAAASLVQASVLLTIGASERHHIALGASVSWLARIIAGQIFLGGSLGYQGYGEIASHHIWMTRWFPLVLALAGLAYVAYAAWKGPIELRLFLLFCALGLGATLVSPLENTNGYYWSALAHPSWNMRYFFFAILAWAAVQVAVLARGNRLARYAAVTVLVVFFVVGIPGDWRYPPFADLHYGEYITRFEHMQPGQSITIPINWGWTMTLKKH